MKTLVTSALAASAAVVAVACGGSGEVPDTSTETIETGTVQQGSPQMYEVTPAVVTIVSALWVDQEVYPGYDNAPREAVCEVDIMNPGNYMIDQLVAQITFESADGKQKYTTMPAISESLMPGQTERERVRAQAPPHGEIPLDSPFSCRVTEIIERDQ